MGWNPLQHTKVSLNFVADRLSRNINEGESITYQLGENYTTRNLREWVENGPDLAPIEKNALPRGDGNFSVGHLRDWAENGQDLPEMRPPTPGQNTG